jgi:hypothetical protein
MNFLATNLQKRQNSNGGLFIIPESYIGVNGDPSPATVVGITLGVVLGIIFIVMLIWWAMYQQSEGFVSKPATIEVHTHPRRRSSRRYSDSEVRRVSRSPRRRVVEERVVEERIAVPRSVSPPYRRREEVIVEPRRRSHRDEEEVIVYEESESTDPMPRRSSRRGRR